MEELYEALATLDDVLDLLDDLVVSGLRAVAPATLSQLRSHSEEFEKTGAMHLGQQLGLLVSSIEADNREAAECMVRLQTSLRLFERVLSLEAASASLRYLAETAGGDELSDEETP